MHERRHDLVGCVATEPKNRPANGLYVFVFPEVERRNCCPADAEKRLPARECGCHRTSSLARDYGGGGMPLPDDSPTVCDPETFENEIVVRATVTIVPSAMVPDEVTLALSSVQPWNCPPETGVSEKVTEPPAPGLCGVPGVMTAFAGSSGVMTSPPPPPAEPPDPPQPMRANPIAKANDLCSFMINMTRKPALAFR
jgi:hypothetical protein